MNIKDLSSWLDDVPISEFSDGAVAIAFNLYEEGDSEWALEVIGTSSFDPDDSDWACDEITDFETRTNPFTWEEDSSWESILEEVKSILTDYLHAGKNADELKKFKGIGVGFVDGDMEIVD